MKKEKMIDLAKKQLEAYNHRNIDLFCTYYHPEVEVFDLNKNEKIISGIALFRERYRSRFAENPRLHCELKSRTVLGQSVLDEEWVTGVEGATAASHVVAIYHFQDDLISKVFFTR